jgi:hypothetical protein
MISRIIINKVLMGLIIKNRIKEQLFIKHIIDKLKII